MMQAFVLAAAGIFARILGFLYRIPMQNLLGDSGTGVYGQSYSLYMFFFVISSAGMPSAISKMVSTRVVLKQYSNALKVLKVAIVIAGTIGFFSMLFMYFGANYLATFLHSRHIVYSLMALSPAVFITSIMSVLRGYFQGFGNSLPTAISQVLEQLLNAIFSVVLVYIFLDYGIEVSAAGGTAASSIGALFGLLFIIWVYFINRKLQNARIKRYKNIEIYEPKKKIAKEIFTTSFPIVIGIAIFSMTNIIDTRMVVVILEEIGFSHDTALNYFGQLSGKFVLLTTLPVSIATAISIALIPSIAASDALNHNDTIKQKVNTSLRFTMLICVPASIGISVLARPIILFLFPNSPDGYRLLQIGGISIIFLALSQVAAGILQGMNFLKIPILAAVLGGIVKIILNYVLISIPSINILGAVFSTIACYFVSSTINLYNVSKKINVKIDFLIVFVKPLFSSIFMGLVCYITFYIVYFVNGNNTISLFSSIIVGCFAYFCVMIFCRGITEKELQNLPLVSVFAKFLRKVGL